MADDPVVLTYQNWKRYDRADSAARNFVSGMDANPDEAARSVQLSQDSGVPAAVIDGDQEQFENQYRTAVSNDLIKQSPPLQQYLSEDPMAARVSHDDLGALDQAAKSISDLNNNWLSKWVGALGKAEQATARMGTAVPPEQTGQMLTEVEGMPRAIANSARRAFGDQPWLTPEQMETLLHGYSQSRPSEIEWAASHPTAGAFYGLGQQLQTAIEVIQGRGEDEAKGIPGVSGAIPRTLGGLLDMGYEGMSYVFGEPFAREMAGIAEMKMMSGDAGELPTSRDAIWRSRLAETGATPAESAAMMARAEQEAVPRPSTDRLIIPRDKRYAAINETLNKNAEEIAGYFHAEKVAGMFTEAGEHPPAGIDPTLDNAMSEEARQNLEGLKQAKRDVDATKTVERSPGHAARLAEIAGPGEVGISARAIRELYGDKAPAPGDGLLGDVITADQLELHELADGDIYVPRSELLVRADAETINNLGDNLRLREGAPTIEVTKPIEPAKADVGEERVEPGFGQKQVIAEPVAAIRGAAGLEPQTRNGNRKITLRRVAAEVRGGRELAEGAGHDWETMSPEDRAEWMKEAEAPTVHDIDILDETGKKVGWLEGVREEEDGKLIRIDHMQAGPAAFYEPQFLGHMAIKDIKRQLMAMFPKAERVRAFRATGAREKVGRPAEIEVKLDAPESEPMRGLLDGVWERPYPGVEALGVSPDKLKPEESIMGQMILDEARRLAPDADVQVVRSLMHEDKPSRGIYMPDIRRILVALDGERPLGTLRHELVHWLRHLAKLTETEWSTLTSQALKEEWQEKLGIDRRYPTLDANKKMEEAIAEGYRRWRAGTLPVKDTTFFEKVKGFFDGLKRQVMDAFGMEREATWEEIFQKIERGETARKPAGREPRQITPEAAAEGARADVGEEKPGAELAKLTFEGGKAARTTEEFMRAEEKHIREVNRRDEEAATKEAAARAKQELAPERKARRSEIATEVREELGRQPDMALDRALSEAGLKIHPDSLSAEQKERLPKDYVQKKNGISIDQLAQLVRAESGDAAAERLAMVTEARKRLGQGQKEYFERQVKAETDRRVEAEFGPKQDELMGQYRDQAMSDATMRMVHEQMRQAAFNLGIDLRGGRWSVADVKAMARSVYERAMIGEHKPARYLQKAGELAMEIAREEQKTPTSRTHDRARREKIYQLLQKRVLNLELARLARGYETQRRQFDALTERFARRPTEAIAKKIDLGYHYIAQVVMKRLRMDTKLSPGELQRGIKIESDKVRDATGMAFDTKDTLRDFMATKRLEYRDVNIPDFILDDPTWPGNKGLEEMTGAEFEALHDMFKTLEAEGKDEKYLVVQGEKIGKEETIEKLINQIQALASLPPKVRGIGEKRTKPQEIAKALKTFWWGLITSESMWDRLDRGDKHGMFHKLLTYPIARAVNLEADMNRDFAKRWASLKLTKKKMNKSVENNVFFHEPTGTFPTLTKREVLGVLMHWGNPSNREKLTKGWKADPARVLDWLQRNTTKEDWDLAQQIGDWFKELFEKADKMSIETTGVPVKRVEIIPFIDPFGVERQGWYSPVDYERTLPTAGVPIDAANVMEGPGYYRANTDQRWSKERTGKVGPVDLTMDMVPQRMTQIIHDIAVRPALLQAKKILEDSRIKREMIAAYGEDAMGEQTSFLRDFAGRRDVETRFTRAVNAIFGFLTKHAVRDMIAFNPGTVLKHSLSAGASSAAQVGGGRLAEATKQFFGPGGTQIRKQIYDESAFMRGRFTNYVDLLAGEGRTIGGEVGSLQWLGELHDWLGQLPISYGDYATAGPTYWAERMKQLERDPTNIELARDVAEAAVREAHGSYTLMGKPGIARETNAIVKSFSQLYSFFSHNLQKVYKFMWQSRDIWNGQKPLDIEGHWMGPMFTKVFAHMIWVAWLEEEITPTLSSENESWAKSLAKMVFSWLGSQFPYAREFVRGVVDPAHPGSAGIIGSAVQAPSRWLNDLNHAASSPEAQGRLIADSAALLGYFSSIHYAQEGRVEEYLWRYHNGLERPKGPWDVASGLWHGTTKGHSHTMDEWWHHTVPGRAVKSVTGY